MRPFSLVLLGLLACDAGQPASRHASRRPATAAPVRPDAGSPTAAAEAEPPPLLRHGASFHAFDEQVPGVALRLLVGGPPYRLCEVRDLASEDPARCTEVTLPAGMQGVEVASADDDAPTLLIASPVISRGPLVEPATGEARVEPPVIDAHVTREGPLAGLDVTNERGFELLRFRAREVSDRVRLSDDPRSLPFLLGDTALFGRRGRLVSSRVLAGDAAFGPAVDHGPVPGWSERRACRAREGTAAALLSGGISRSSERDEDGLASATAVFSRDGVVRTTQARLPEGRPVISCDGEIISAAFSATDRRAGSAKRRHDVRLIRCAPDGCTDRQVRLEGFEAWNPPAAAIGERVLLVRARGGDVLGRVAPLETLASAPDRVLLHGANEPASIRLLPRGGLVAVLVDYRDHAVLLSVAPDGDSRVVRSEPALPALPDGVPRHGGGP